MRLILCAVISVEDNRDAVCGGDASNVVSSGNSAGNAGLLVLVVNALACVSSAFGVFVSRRLGWIGDFGQKGRGRSDRATWGKLLTSKVRSTTYTNVSRHLYMYFECLLALGGLEDDWGGLVACGLERGNDGGGASYVDGGDGETLLLGIFEEVEN